MTRASTRVWIAVATLTLQGAIGLSYTWGALAPFAFTQTHWTSLQVAAMFSATPAGFGFGVVVAGRLADVHPARLLLRVAYAIFAGGFLVAFVFPNPYTLIILYAGISVGFAAGFSLAAGLAALRQTFPERVGTLGGIQSAVFAGSALALVPVVTTLAPRLGWVAGLGITGGTLAVLSGIAILQMPALPRPAPHESGAHPPLAAVARNPLVWSAFMIQLTATPLGSYSFVHVGLQATRLGLVAWIVSAVVSAFIAGNGSGRLIAGAATDRWGVHVVVAGLYACSLVGAALLILGKTPVTVFVGSLLVGIGFGAPAGILPRLSAEAMPSAPNTASGLIFTGYTTGAFAGPLLGELISPAPTGWIEMVALPVLGLVVLALRVRYSRSRGLRAKVSMVSSSSRGTESNE